MPPTPICWLWPIFALFETKTMFLGSGTITSALKFGAIFRSPCPKLNFLKPFRTKFNDFPKLLQVCFFGTFRIFGAHKFLQMWGLHGLPSTPMDAPWKVSMEEDSFSPRSWIWDQHLPKTIFKSVRRPFSSWSDRRSFQVSLWVIRAFVGLIFRIIRVFGVHIFLHP